LPKDVWEQVTICCLLFMRKKTAATFFAHALSSSHVREGENGRNLMHIQADGPSYQSHLEICIAD
jgi:hypothetical protein